MVACVVVFYIFTSVATQKTQRLIQEPALREDMSVSCDVLIGNISRLFVQKCALSRNIFSPGVPSNSKTLVHTCVRNIFTQTFDNSVKWVLTFTIWNFVQSKTLCTLLSSLHTKWFVFNFELQTTESTVTLDEPQYKTKGKLKLEPIKNVYLKKKTDLNVFGSDPLWESLTGKKAALFSGENKNFALSYKDLCACLCF